jgi:hypothetical protein
MSNSTSKTRTGQPSSNGQSIKRFARGQPCPICGGSDSDRRGQGQRCSGFISGDWVHCSREEHGGQAKFHAESRTYSHRPTGPCPCGIEHAPAPPGSDRGKAPRKEIDHVYKYRNAEGQTVHETVRYRNPKTFSQRRPMGGGKYAWSLAGVEPVLYNLPELLTADPSIPVWIPEGEKDVDRLGILGLVATTNPMGALKWLDHYSEALRGRVCYIIPDNDPPEEKYPDGKGRCHAQQVALSLHGKATSVKIVELPGLPSKGDVSDWLDNQPESWEPDDCRLELERIAAAAAAWSPPSEGAGGPQPSKNGDGHHASGHNGTIDYAKYSDEQLGLISAEDVVPEAVDWLWKYHLARGEMAIVAGEGGLGKSMFLLTCATAVSNGGPWPDRSGNAPIGHVVILSAEDNPETTLKPRLMALGANLKNITFCKARTITMKDGQRLVNPKSLQDRAYWKAVFDRHQDTLLFIVDPIPSYLGKGVNDRQNSEIREVLEPFIEDVIRDRKINMYCNTHLNKSVDARTPVQRITGSIAYANIPRNVQIIVRDPDEFERRFFKQCKCNNGPDDLKAVGFRIEQHTVKFGDLLIETAIPIFDADLHSIDLTSLMNGDKGRRGPRPVKSSRVAEWLRDQLQEGEPVLMMDLIRRAREKNFILTPTPENPKTSITNLYDGRDRLLEENPNWKIDLVEIDSERGGVPKRLKAWRLVKGPKDQVEDPGQFPIDDGGVPY